MDIRCIAVTRKGLRCTKERHMTILCTIHEKMFDKIYAKLPRCNLNILTLLHSIPEVMEFTINYNLYLCNKDLYQIYEKYTKYYLLLTNKKNKELSMLPLPKINITIPPDVDMDNLIAHMYDLLVVSDLTQEYFITTKHNLIQKLYEMNKRLYVVSIYPCTSNSINFYIPSTYNYCTI